MLCLLVLKEFIVCTHFGGGGHEWCAWQELYHELHALDRDQMDLKRKQHEEALIISDGGTPVACGAHPPPLKEHQVF